MYMEMNVEEVKCSCFQEVSQRGIKCGGKGVYVYQQSIT